MIKSIRKSILEAQSRKEAIHRKLKAKHPKSVIKAKKIFRFKYPKLVTLVILIIVAYFVFQSPVINEKIKSLERFNYLGIFVAGIFFSFGFLTPFAIGFFIVSNPSNLLMASIIGAIGSVIGDMIIFKIIKFSFLDEFKELEKTKTIHFIKEKVKSHAPTLIRHYLIYAFAGIFIASPLPDEFGVSMLAGLTTIKPKTLAMLSFILHAIPIYLILLI